MRKKVNAIWLFPAAVAAHGILLFLYGLLNKLLPMPEGIATSFAASLAIMEAPLRGLLVKLHLMKYGVWESWPSLLLGLLFIHGFWLGGTLLLAFLVHIIWPQAPKLSSGKKEDRAGG